MPTATPTRAAKPRRTPTPTPTPTAAPTTVPDGYLAPPVSKAATPMAAATLAECKRRYREAQKGGASGAVGQWRKAECKAPTDAELLAYTLAMHGRGVASTTGLEIAYWLGWPTDLLGKAPAGMPAAPLACSRGRWLATWPVGATPATPTPTAKP